MRLSDLFARTLRDDPSEAEVSSHRLLLRAAFIRQLASGVYTTMPLGLRTLRKIEDIVRDEMDLSGAQELRMPILLPAEPWKATGRWDAYGDLLFKVEDRHGRQFVLGPTEEEAITPLVTAELESYRDLPVNLYQIEWKYRDEFRPRFGLLRGREFLMKDAYSFDRDEDGMKAAYETMYDAYSRIFDRCGLDYFVVEADPGQIGGGTNHEYMALSEVGEDLFVSCANGDYLADVEAATPRLPEVAEAGELESMQTIDTPGAWSIDAVSALLGRPASDMLKCIMFKAADETVAVLVPGDRDVNEDKVARLFFPVPTELFDDDDFTTRGFVKGFVGPQDMPAGVTIVADHHVRGGRDWVAGANQVDAHVTGLNAERDFRIDRWEDVVHIKSGDPCPIDGGELSVGRSIVVGHIYQLGTKYSEPLNATFVDEDGSDRFYEMGCYGIGISRILAAVVEQSHDDAGIIWPKALSPFEVVVINATKDNEEAVEEAERIYGELAELGVEVALDDREVAAGVKFNDADLIGYPVQVVVGKRGVEAGTVDLKLRVSSEKSQAPLVDASQAVVALLGRAP